MIYVVYVTPEARGTRETNLLMNTNHGSLMDREEPNALKISFLVK
jgi:hypothetical protein